MQLRSFKLILIDVLKAMRKKFKKDKLFIFKLIMYSAYVYISGNKAISCFKLLMLQFKKKYHSLTFAMLSLLYLVFVMV